MSEPTSTTTTTSHWIQETVRHAAFMHESSGDLCYFNARWYKANTGRFTMEGPIRDRWSWYQYVGSNPLRYVDPTGLYQVWGQLQDGEMRYGISTMGRAERLINSATNAIANTTPVIGPGVAQRLRLGLERFGGRVGRNRFDIYYDSDFAGFDGAGAAVDVGELVSRPLSALGKAITNTLDIAGLIDQGGEDIRGLIEDSRVEVFTEGLQTGLFGAISSPEEAVERAEQFVSGVTAFFDHDLEQAGISFEEWQNALRDEWTTLRVRGNARRARPSGDEQAVLSRVYGRRALAGRGDGAPTEALLRDAPA